MTPPAILRWNHSHTKQISPYRKIGISTQYALNWDVYIGVGTEGSWYAPE